MCRALFSAAYVMTCDSTRICEFETSADAQIEHFQPKSRNLTKTHHARKPVRARFSGPWLRMDTALGTKYSSNNYLGLFLISSQTIFKIQRTSRSKTSIATKSFYPRRAEFLHFTDITLRSKAALRIISSTDVRQHPIL